MKKKVFACLLLLSMCLAAFQSTAYAQSVSNAENEMKYGEFILKKAQLPEIPLKPDLNDQYRLTEETRAQMDAWWDARMAHKRVTIPELKMLQNFARESARQLSENRQTPNFLYSPVSLWFCLHTLADLTAGDTQAQILRVIGEQPDETRDQQKDAVFQALYWDDETSVCVPAMSVWLDRGTGIAGPLLDKLAAAHNTVFQGPMEEAAFNEALQAWLNEKTRGLLTDSVSGLHMSPNSGLAVYSTLYLKNGWLSHFSKGATSPDVFYADSGELTTDFMHKSEKGRIYEGEGFTAAILDFENGGGVTFLLPDEGVSPEELLSGEDAFRFLLSGNDRVTARYGKIHYSVPKIDCKVELSLRDTLEKMGVTALFDPQRAQFSPELSSNSPITLSVPEQYARLILNEEGVEAAAITMVMNATASLYKMEVEDIYFTLNRPFAYAVISEQGIPLFIGTCYAPE